MSKEVERNRPRPIFENEVASYLRDHFPFVSVRKPAERLGRGVFSDLPCELTTTARGSSHADHEMLDAARASADLTGAPLGATVRRRAGSHIGQSTVSVTLEDFVQLLRRAAT